MSAPDTSTCVAPQRRPLLGLRRKPGRLALAPHRLHLLQSVLGWGDLNDDTALRQFVVAHPMAAFRPKPAS